MTNKIHDFDHVDNKNNKNDSNRKLPSENSF